MKSREFDTAHGTDHLDKLINEREVAAYLGYSIRTLQNWRVRGGGPNYVKVSERSVRYRRRDINEWIEARIRSNTSEELAA